MFAKDRDLREGLVCLFRSRDMGEGFQRGGFFPTMPRRVSCWRCSYLDGIGEQFVLVYDALEHRSTQSGVPTAGNPSVAGKVASQTPGATGLAGYGGVAQGVGAL